MARFSNVLVMLLAASSSVESFAPVTGSGATVKAAVPSSFTGNQVALHYGTEAKRSLLYMKSDNIFERVVRVAKANINNALKNLEDPEKVMTQALKDMQVSFDHQF
jgi:hypothetical protein